MEKKNSTPDPQKNLNKKNSTGTSGLKSFVRYSGLGFQMLAVILIFYWAGTKLDERSAAEKPIFTAILTVLGVFAGIYIALKDIIFPRDE